MKKWTVDESAEDVFADDAASLARAPTKDYIEDPEKALTLLSRVVGQVHGAAAAHACSGGPTVSMLRKNWLEHLRRIMPVELKDHLGFQRRAMACCDRMRDRKLASAVRGKIVLGVGGRFSSGKSAFINAVVGLGSLLPEDGRPTTSIPTYITKGHERRFWLTSQQGRESREIDSAELQALSHEFDDRYHIGFSSFINSCVISTPDFRISPRIVLLDTPGYSRAEDCDRAFSLSDKEMALKLLRRSDRLVWVVQQENGSIGEEDIRFLADIGHERPILIVVTHADQIGPTSMRNVIDTISKDTKDLECGVFGIAGWGRYDAEDGVSLIGREFDGGHIVRDFLKDVASEDMGKNDVVGQLDILEQDVFAALQTVERNLDERTSELNRYIARTKKVTAMQSLALLMDLCESRLKAVRARLEDYPEYRAQRLALVRALTEVTHEA